MKKLNLITILFLMTAPLSVHAIMCPNSFKQINFGDTMDRVASVCGAPDSQYQYTDTVSETSGNTYVAPNYFYGFGNNYYQPYGFTTTQQNQTVSHEKRITKFIYNGMQPAVLIFVNGQLEERQLIPQ